MRTTEDQQAAVLIVVCANVHYKPGWMFNPVNAEGVMITWRALSATNPEKHLSLSHFVTITDFRTDEAIAARLYAACEYLELHEVKEWFTYKGRRLFGFGPHG